MPYFSVPDTEVAPGNDSGTQFFQDFGAALLTGKFS